MSQVLWQELLSKLAKDWGATEMALLNEAVSDLSIKLDTKKKRISGRTALVVEDSKILRIMLEDCLTKAGIIVTGRAQNGYEAVQMYNGEERYDYVFLNVTMPELDGIEALIDFKKDRKSKIIMVTSMKQPEFFLKFIKNGAHHVLYRPFEPGTLLSVVCSETFLSPDKYAKSIQMLSEMGKGLDKPGCELTQQDIFKLVYTLLLD